MDLIFDAKSDDSLKLWILQPLTCIENFLSWGHGTSRKLSNHSHFPNSPAASLVKIGLSRFLFMKGYSTHNSTESSLFTLQIKSIGYFGLKIAKNRNFSSFRAFFNSSNLTKMPQIGNFSVSQMQTIDSTSLRHTFNNFVGQCYWSAEHCT